MSLEACEKYGTEKEEYRYVFQQNEQDDTTKSIEEKSTSNSKNRLGLKHILKNAFLPQGYPDSVSNDYVEYQLWDTMQAFCSSITGTLATQAVLKGYGVGDQTATVAGATLTWMLKDGMGMIGRIMFAWLKGTQLDCDAKRWRLFADIVNDLAILLDLIAPLFKPIFVFLVCISSVARSLVGVAGGATRAALTLHQARRDNMADVSAKDGSQETLVNLLALLAGFVITPIVADNQLLVWLFFFVFTFLHLFANYRAVSCVVMETVNLPRLHLLLTEFVKSKEVLTPLVISKLDPVLRSPGFSSVIKVGARMRSVVKTFEDLNFADSNSCMYFVGLDKKRRELNVALHTDANNKDIHKSCFHAVLMDILCNASVGDVADMCPEVRDFLTKSDLKQVEMTSSHQMEKVQEFVETLYPVFEDGLLQAGWNLKICHLGVDEWRSQWNKKSK